MASFSVDTWSETSGDNPEVFDIPRDVFGKTAIKALAGWKGVAIWDEAVNPVDLAREYASRIAGESCGKCTPCRLGSAHVKAVMERICEGQGREMDLEELPDILKFVSETSRCDIGKTLAKPVLDLLDNYRNVFEETVRSGVQVPRGEYASTLTAPCMAACPSNVDIPGYIEALRDGKPALALEIVRRDCPMPGTIGRVCVRPCESNCRRGLVDEPLAIKAIKRYLADNEKRSKTSGGSTPVPPKNGKVAVVGAGPAGLSAAYYLGTLGYKTTIFERQEKAGGMAAWGIPDYRLPRDVLDDEIEKVRELGAEFQYGVDIGKDIKLEKLAEQGYRAVFLGVGAPVSAKMRCKGEDDGYDGFMTGIEFLAKAARGKRPLEGRRAVVVGGGNVAMDCVRTIRRLGFEDVKIIYRRTEAEMPADPLEIKEAKEEGVDFQFLVAPLRIIAENNKITGMECLRMELGEPDPSGRRRPIPIDGSNFIIACDAVIPAVGQAATVDRVISDNGTVSRWNTLLVDEVTLQTKRMGIFGGGDCATGPDTLIAALAAGKKAAHFIDQYLTQGHSSLSGEELVERIVRRAGVFDAGETFPYHGYEHQAHPQVAAPEVRVKDFSEVEGGLTAAQARHEAERCLRCYRVVVAAL